MASPICCGCLAGPPGLQGSKGTQREDRRCRAALGVQPPGRGRGGRTGASTDCLPGASHVAVSEVAH
eukprot:2205344-Alexandrium_andersonii.AAC.1